MNTENSTTLPEISDAHKIIEAALEKQASDPGAIFEEDVIDAFHSIDSADFMRFKTRAKAIGNVNLNDLNRALKLPIQTTAKPNTRVVDLAAEKCEFCHDAEGRGVAIINGDTHREVWLIRDAGFSNWLNSTYFKVSGEALSSGTLKTALGTMDAMGLNSGKKIDLRVRCAKFNDAYYIDLCDSRWRAIKVDESGYVIQEKSDVYFTRSTNSRPLPDPVQGGSIEQQRK